MGAITRKFQERDVQAMECDSDEYDAIIGMDIIQRTSM